MYRAFTQHEILEMALTRVSDTTSTNSSVAEAPETHLRCGRRICLRLQTPYILKDLGITCRIALDRSDILYCYKVFRRK